MKNKGITFVALIMIIVLLAIIVAGITSYITEGLRLNVSNINQEKALYMAQAGIMSAIVDYRVDGLWSAVQNNNDAGGEFYYHVGRDADFLWVDASSPQASAKTLKRIPIKNINASSSITITSMVVSWTFGGNITGVTLANNNVWTGSLSSPATLDITDTTIASGAQFANTNNQIWEFSINVPTDSTADIVVTFVFSDGSSCKAYLLKGGEGANKESSITATGEIRAGASNTARRTLVATYDIGPDSIVGTSDDRITSWQEGISHIIP